MRVAAHATKHPAQAHESERQAYLTAKLKLNPEQAKWLNKGRPELPVPNVTAAVATAISTPSSCVPDGGVLLSMTNVHHSRLRRLQFARFADTPCFMNRVVSVCYGLQPTASKAQSKNNDTSPSLGVCVHGPPVPPSDFKRSQYVALNWAKWPIFRDALVVARVVLWLEADVLILRNPWSFLPETATPSFQSQSQPYDIRYQPEAFPCESELQVGVGVKLRGNCELHPEPINCGQLVVSR